MDAIEVLSNALNKQSEHFTAEELAQKLKTSKKTISFIKNKRGPFKVGLVIKWLLLVGTRVEIQILDHEIQFTVEDANKDLKAGKGELKNIIREIVNTKFKSFRDASLSIEKKDNYIWDSLNQQRTSIEGLLNIAELLTGDVKMYANNKRISYIKADIFKPD